MNKKAMCVRDWVLVVLLIIPLSGCSMAWEVQTKQKVTDEQLFGTVTELIEEQKDVVWPYIEEEMSRANIAHVPSSKEIVANTMEEQKGREYLEFCYAVGSGSGEVSVEAVTEQAKLLLSEQEQQILQEKMEATRSLLLAKADTMARGLAPSQRAAFWKDMQKLVTRSLVLFTAGIVYAFMPTVVFWGKVSAATAVAIASGIVASTLMSIWRYYQFGGDLDETFSEWLTAVTTEPELSYALAASIISVGQTLKRGVVVTGIILCVFALYNVMDLVKPMLQKYDFTV